MEYRLQSMYNHMVGRTASVVPPFYSLLPGWHLLTDKSLYTVQMRRLIIHSTAIVDYSLFTSKPLSMLTLQSKLSSGFALGLKGLH